MKDKTNNTYKLIYGKDIELITDRLYLNERKTLLKGIRAKFSIEYPDGYKIHYEPK